MKDFSLLASEIEKVIETINFKKVYAYINIQKIAIYNDGFLYFSTHNEPFKQGVRDNLDLTKEFAILNSEQLSDDNNINAGFFIKQMVLNMFYKKHDKRIPNDLIALQYPKIYLNFDYMQYERRLLIKAVTSTDVYVKINYFRMFLNVRDLRRQMIGNEFSMLEYGLETINGLAEYTMYKAIYYLDKKLAKTITKELIGSFISLGKDHFDFRHSNVYSGLFLLLIMSDLQVEIDNIYYSDQTLYQIATRKINFIREPIAYRSDKNLLEKITEYEASISEKFAVFFENEPKRVNGYFQIFSYDPERVFVDKDTFYHESFVVLKNLLNNELIKIEGPVVTKILDNSFDIVTSYFYIELKRNPKKSKRRSK